MSGGTITHLLQSWRAGDQAALDELMALAYEELHRLAAVHMRRERPEHTLRPTELISEVYLRLSGASPVDLNDRNHFFAIAARSMRRILVDHAYKRSAVKRGGGAAPVQLDESLVALDRPDEILAIDRALSGLAELDERKAKVMELHYFGGLGQKEIAQVLEIHINTVARDLRFSEAWIQNQLATK